MNNERRWQERWQEQWDKTGDGIKTDYEVHEKCYYVNDQEIIPVIVVNDLGSSASMGGPVVFNYQVVTGEGKTYMTTHLSLRTLDFYDYSEEE